MLLGISSSNPDGWRLELIRAHTRSSSSSTFQRTDRQPAAGAAPAPAARPRSPRAPRPNAQPSCDHTRPAPPLGGTSRPVITPQGSPSLPPVSSRSASRSRVNNNARSSTDTSGQNRGEKRWPPMGRNLGRQWGEFSGRLWGGFHGRPQPGVSPVGSYAEWAQRPRVCPAQGGVAILTLRIISNVADERRAGSLGRLYLTMASRSRARWYRPDPATDHCPSSGTRATKRVLTKRLLRTDEKRDEGPDRRQRIYPQPLRVASATAMFARKAAAHCG